jgi:Cdc6-like AAA superfamily ATPase
VFHVPQTAERAQTLLKQLSNFKLFPVTMATLQMVCQDAHNSFYTSSIRMKKPHITDLKLQYGDGFPEIHKELLEMLQEKDSTGITFLHGPPGTGKTHYLRYLINEIEDKSLIYIPPDLVNVSQFLIWFESPFFKVFVQNDHIAGQRLSKNEND